MYFVRIVSTEAELRYKI